MEHSVNKTSIFKSFMPYFNRVIMIKGPISRPTISANLLNIYFIIIGKVFNSGAWSLGIGAKHAKCAEQFHSEDMKIVFLSFLRL